MTTKQQIKKNEFLRNAFDILKDLSRKISEKEITTNEDKISASLFFAIAVEKLLKGIIYDINPLYILAFPEFKNSVGVYYSNKVKNINDLEKKPNNDVIAFQSTVMRALTFSKSVFDHKNTLMKIKDARDIIVHHNFSQLDFDELSNLLNRDFYPLLNAISIEHNLGGQTNIFNNLHSKLALISSELQDDTTERLKLQIESAANYWKTLKGVATYQKSKFDMLTLELLEMEPYYPAKCPSCDNIAVVYTEPICEFNPYLKEDIQVGLDVFQLECHYCKLCVDDYNALDFLKIEPSVHNKEEVIAGLKLKQ